MAGLCAARAGPGWGRAGDVSVRADVRERAGGGDGEAALEIARAYDPDTPRQDALVPEANLAFARLWYRKAADLGVTEASSRLAELPE